MRKANVISISEARKALNGKFRLSVQSGWARTAEEFLISNVCRSKIEGKIDIKGKNLHRAVTENEFNQLMRYGPVESQETVDGCTFTNKVRLVVAPQLVKTVKLSLWGGYHNASSINVIIPASDYECIRDHVATIDEVLSEAQLSRVQRHFCGVEGCSCGGVRRASMERVKS